MTSEEAEVLMERIVAAILTISVVGNQGSTAEWVVARYAEVLKAVQKAGGAINPMVQGHG